MIVGTPVRGEPGYCDDREMPDKGIRRRWTYRGYPRSIEWNTKGRVIVKSWNKFDDHQNADDMRALLDECASRNVDQPSGYGDLFHKRWQMPPLRAAHRKLYAGQVRGGWNGVITTLLKDADLGERNGIVRRPMWQYDIRSAYLWALSQGLPHPDTFRLVRRVAGPGLYWCPSPCHPLLPYPWNQPGQYPATEDELLTLPLDHKAITRGIAFEPGSMPTARMVDDIRAWSCWKAVARSYWGRWIASANAVAETFKADELNTSRDLVDPQRNPVYGALITSRLRNRLWQLVDNPERRVYRVQTDSIITDTPLDCGPNVGDWKEIAYFPDGGRVSPVGVKSLAA